MILKYHLFGLTAEGKEDLSICVEYKLEKN